VRPTYQRDKALVRAARGSQLGLGISQFLQGCVPIRYPSPWGYQPVVGQRLGNGARPWWCSGLLYLAPVPRQGGVVAVLELAGGVPPAAATRRQLVLDRSDYRRHHPG
jgi:hypothetical protein